MRNLILLIFLCVVASCSNVGNKYNEQIETTIKMLEAGKGNKVVSVTIVSQRDSGQFHVVDYNAVLNNNNRQPDQHIIFARTGDNFLSPM